MKSIVFARYLYFLNTFFKKYNRAVTQQTSFVQFEYEETETTKNSTIYDLLYLPDCFIEKKKRARIIFFGAFDKHIIIKFYILHVIYILRVNQYFFISIK